MSERVTELTRFLSELQELGQEGHPTRGLQQEAWQQIQEAVDTKVSAEQDKSREILTQPINVRKT